MRHRTKTLWEIPNVISFLIGFAIALIGLAAAVWHVIGWVRTNHWQAATDGEMLVQFGYSEDHSGWSALQGVVDAWWTAPFWAVTLGIGVVIIYLPSLLRTILGR